jgi:ribosomal protein S18 acetylase RimI-like enzyme
MQTCQWRVRQLTPQDADAYQALRLQGLEESPTSFSSSYSDEAGRTRSEIEARLALSPDGSRVVFGAFVGDRLAGLLAVMRQERPKLRHCADLMGMYVVPEYRRHGLGGALVDTALRHARTLPGVRQVKLTVNASNLAARSLYQSRGFTCAGVHSEAICVDGVYYDEELYVLRIPEPA